ncbi:hypothetical protein [Aurantimonas sp. 22II-16-19i]|uniref:phage tail terminator protein n=1 Tax=Aurantimonas sp. 22II-16-19i TaxID=1317114 RepID=UPI0009F7A3A9|nr:hypothetical protein [Aurantimonas sp. 22II-16-19i]ORE87818.1 hypothetical protein ATO4_25043 [Aurantimonas sp. 22II-16-19i]
MIVTEIKDRLVERCGSAFGMIGDALDLAAVREQPLASPALFVVPLREVSAGNSRMTGVLQRSEIDFGVVIIVDNISDTTGAAAGQDLEVLKTAVRAALIGWQPASAEDIITHVSGELTGSREGTVWWEEVFAAATYLEDEES